MYLKVIWQQQNFAQIVCYPLSYSDVQTGQVGLHLSIVAGLVVRHGDLSHEMTLSHEGRRPECDNVNRQC